MGLKYSIVQSIKNGWIFDKSVYDALTDHEKSFIDFELGTYKTIDFYKERLKCIGFNNKESVLNAGCGIGQWSIALSDLNNRVEAIDVIKRRIDFATSFARTMGKKNIQFNIGSIETLPYQDAYFDSIFCYSTIIYIDVEKTLNEFYRVLKPGGKLYINFNSLGWYAYLIINKGFKKLHLGVAYQALRMCFRYLIGCTNQILVREHWLYKKLAKSGFKSSTFASEGHLTPNLQPNHVKPRSIYQSHYCGMRSVIEVIATK